jgi:hypothetical protein
MDRKFTQEELTAAYNQMREERHREHEYAAIAAKLLNAKLVAAGWSDGRFNSYQSNGCGFDHIPALFGMCLKTPRWSDWYILIEKLKAAGIKMQPWDGNRFHYPQGEFDLTGNPEFPEDAPQKEFPLHIKHAFEWELD